MQRFASFANSLRLLAWLLVGLGLGPWSDAARAVQDPEPRIYAALDDGVVKFGARTFLRIEVEGSQNARITALPEVEGLEIEPPSSPTVTQSIRLIGGRRMVSRTISWAVPVRPSRTGDFELPGVQLEVDGRPALSRAVRLSVVEDLRGQELGVLRFNGVPSRVVDGQSFDLDITLGWDEQLRSVNFADLILPWWGNVPGALLEPQEPPPNAGAGSVSLNRVGALRVEQRPPFELNGRRYRAFGVRVRVTPLRSGTLELTGNVLRFGEVVDSGFGLLSRRTELASEYFSRADDVVLSVEELPTENQPLDFTGAVGEFRVAASAEPRDLEIGEELTLTYDVSGAGNVAYLRAPEPDTRGAFEGFDYLGFIEDESGLAQGRRRFRYSLVPTDPTLTELPPLELPVFNTSTWSYERIGPEPIEIRVRDLEGRVDLSGGEERFADDIRDVATVGLRSGWPGSRAPGGRTIASAGLGILLSWLALRTATRAGGRDPGSQLERRRARALRQLERELRVSLDPETDLIAWNEFLASRTGEPLNAWRGRDVDAWAEDTDSRRGGARFELSDAALRTLEHTSRELETTVFGQRAGRVRREHLVEAAKELLEAGL
jgi:hypothetical protein